MGSFIHVDHILVAEFDIDRGAQLTFQYPYDTGTDPHVLAELMLPDGAHLREEDWTMFFLNQRTPNQNDAVPTVQRQRRNQGADTSKNGNLTIDAHGYSYVQGSWRTISTKPRVSICLEEGQVTVWNGLMSQKLHEINLMSNAEYRQIEPLCLCVFFEGKTLAFRFENEDDEILLLNHLDVALYMSRKFTRGLVLPPPPPSETGGRPLLYVQNLVRTKQVPGARRGARVKAIAVASRHQWVYVFKPSLLVAMEEYFASDGDESIIANLYDSLNAMDISLMPRLTLAERNILRASEDRNMFDEKFLEMEERAYYRNIDDGGMRNSGSFTSTNKDRHFYETKIEYQGIRMPLRIPLAVFPEEIGDFSVIQLVTTFSALNAIAPPPGAGTLQWKNGAPYYWHFHLDSGPNTHPIVLLMNALLTQKRIVFLGHQRAAGDVANYVLAACAIASGGGALLKGFAERCFPYVSLAGLDNLLSVPGFIAGVTNPVFEEQTSWWDVLFNINTGRISVSSKIEVKDIRVMAENKDYSKDKSREWMKSGSWEGDDDFVGEVIFAIQAHMGELYVRQKFYDHVRRFVEVTAAFELESIGTTGIGMTPINTGNADLGVGAYFVDEATKRKEMLMLRNRMEGWRSTRSYLFYQKDFQNYLRRRPIKELDLRHAASRLRASSSLEESTVVQLFMTLQDNLVKQSDAGLIELLSLLPQNMGGLMPVATGMFHARWEVRRASTRILWRLDWHKVGTRFIQNMNPFFRLCYSRSSHDLLMASEREAYLEDPSFSDTLKMIMSSKSVEPALESEKIKTEKRLENRRNTVRMSIMFEAKNATRLNFRTNSLLPPPPVPQLPKNVSPTPPPRNMSPLPQRNSPVPERRDMQRTAPASYAQDPPSAAAPPRQQVTTPSPLSVSTTVDTLSREQRSAQSSLSRSVQKLDDFMALLDAARSGDDDWTTQPEPQAAQTGQNYTQAPRRVDSVQRNDVVGRLKQQHQSVLTDSSDKDPVSSFYLNSSSPPETSRQNTAPPRPVNVSTVDYPHYVGAERKSSLNSPRDHPRSPGPSSPSQSFSQGSPRAMGAASTRQQHQNPQQISPSSPSDVVKKLLAAQEANNAEMRRRLTKVATTEIADLSPITGEPRQYPAIKPPSEVSIRNEPSADSGYPHPQSIRTPSGGGSLPRAPPPMSPRLNMAPPMSPRGMQPKKLNSSQDLGGSPPMSPRMAPKRINLAAGSPGEGAQRDGAKVLAVAPPRGVVTPVNWNGRQNSNNEEQGRR